MIPDYMHALCDARCCLAALADAAGSADESSYYKQLLISLDDLEPDGPVTWPISGGREELLLRLEVAIERMVRLGATGSALSVRSAAPSRGRPKREESQSASPCCRGW